MRSWPNCAILHRFGIEWRFCDQNVLIVLHCARCVRNHLGVIEWVGGQGLDGFGRWGLIT